MNRKKASELSLVLLLELIVENFKFQHCYGCLLTGNGMWSQSYGLTFIQRY